VYLYLARLAWPTSSMTLLVGHIVIATPYVIRCVTAGLVGMGLRLEGAAMSLGASRPQAFLKVTLPLLRSSLVTGAVFAFIISFRDIDLGPVPRRRQRAQPARPDPEEGDRHPARRAAVPDGALDHRPGLPHREGPDPVGRLLGRPAQRRGDADPSSRRLSRLLERRNSAPVSTSSTPGSFRARSTSTETILAWLSGLRTKATSSTPGSFTSST